MIPVCYVFSIGLAFNGNSIAGDYRGSLADAIEVLSATITFTEIPGFVWSLIPKMYLPGFSSAQLAPFT